MAPRERILDRAVRPGFLPGPRTPPRTRRSLPVHRAPRRLAAQRLTGTDAHLGTRATRHAANHPRPGPPRQRVRADPRPPLCHRDRYPPLDWLLRQRVLAARDLLETTPASVDEIATRCSIRPQPACAPTSAATWRQRRPPTATHRRPAAAPMAHPRRAARRDRGRPRRDPTTLGHDRAHSKAAVALDAARAVAADHLRKPRRLTRKASSSSMASVCRRSSGTPASA